MKRRYQIEKQRAVQQFRQLATEQNPNIQMVLPLAEINGLLQQGLGLLRPAGLAPMSLVMDEEVRSLAGERHEQHVGPSAHGWGKQDGYCVVDGQVQRLRTNCSSAAYPCQPACGSATYRVIFRRNTRPR
jgi:hypothetical protein